MSSKQLTRGLYLCVVTNIIIPGFLWGGILMTLVGFLSIVGPKDPEYAAFFFIGGICVVGWITGRAFFRAVR